MTRILPALLLLLAAPAFAQEAPPAEVEAVHHAPPPLMEEAAPEAPAVAAPPAAAAPVPVTSDQRFGAMLAFRQRHLDLRGFTRWEGGGAVVLHSGWGWGGPWWHSGFGTSYVIPTAPDRVDDWGVYRGPTRLTIPGYLEAIGDDGGSRALQGSIAHAQRTSSAFYTAGGVGLAATLVGFLGAASARDIDTFHTWNVVSTAGLLVGITGVVVGRGQAGRARRMTHDYSGTLDYGEAQAQVDTYNEQLRLELGLSEADVYPILTEQAPRRR
ncbi:MAG: hypothetical protein ABIO70_07270 [Pseudomonadota bacterium]